MYRMLTSIPNTLNTPAKLSLVLPVFLLTACKTDIAPEWETHYSHAQAEESRVEWLASMQVDSFGDVISGGSTVRTGANRQQDISLVKQDSQGNVIWSRYYDLADGDYRSDDKITDIVVDDEGATYAIGVQYIVENETQRYGSFLVKVDAYGDLIWSRHLSDQEDARDIELYNDKLYIAGNAAQVFSTDGERLLHIQQELTWDIEVDEAGNFYTAGATKVYKYDEHGSLVWVTDLQADLYPQASLSVNIDGSLVVAHNQDDRSTRVSGIDETGLITWTRTYQPAVQSYGFPGPALVKRDWRGDIILSLSNDQGRRLVKLDDLGRQAWQITGKGIVQDLAINDSGDIFAIGGGINEKYDANGEFIASTIATRGTQITTGSIVLDGDAMYVGYSAVNDGDIQLYLAKFIDE